MHPLHSELAQAREPLALYMRVRKLARKTEPLDAVAATLGTLGLDGVPNARMVLVKEVEDESSVEPGFIFYTNRKSTKGKEMAAHPFASLVFHYPSLRVQVRVRGGVLQVSEKRSDAYFRARPRLSQLGAWASKQSEAIEHIEQLRQRFVEFEEQYRDEIVPRPPHWGGYRVDPSAIEFWLEGQHRLHERVIFARKAGAWSRTWLAP